MRQDEAEADPEPAVAGRGSGLAGALVAALGALAAIHLLLESYAATHLYLGMDLRALYASGRLWNEGILPWGRVPDPGEPGPVNYPPAALVLFGLAARLPYPELRLLWWAGQWLALGLSVFLLLRLAARRLAAALLWILLALSTPVLVQFERGQVEMLLLALVAGAVYLKAARGSDLVPGLLLALAASVKLYPGLLAAWMLLRARRMLLAFVAGVLAIAAPTAIVHGTRPFAAFLASLSGDAPGARIASGFAERAGGPALMPRAGFPTSAHAFAVTADGEPYLYGIWAMAESQTAAGYLFRILDALGADGLAPHALALVALLAIGGASAATLRGRSRATGASTGAACEMSLWLMTALLCLPRAWPFTYVLSLVPTVALLGALDPADARARPRLAVLCLAVVLIHAPPPPVSLAFGWQAWPGCLVGGIVLYLLLLRQVAGGEHREAQRQVDSRLEHPRAQRAAERKRGE